MKPVLSRAQMRAHDRYAIETWHVPGLVLMENAGRGATDVIGQLVPLASSRIVVVCGAGNNGGDGFVVARHLLARGAPVQVILIGASEKVTGDARVNHNAYIDLGGTFTKLEPTDGLTTLEDALSRADMMVDALFGTGLDRPVNAYYAQVIAMINRAPGRRIALDLPSGMDADTGVTLGAAVQAHETITFGHLKMGLATPQGIHLAGNVHRVDLGVPDSLVMRTGHAAQLIEYADVASWVVPREAGAYKTLAGSVGIIAGSAGKIGAAVLAAEASLYAGAGLCTVATWAEAAPALETRAREWMTARIDRSKIASSLDAVVHSKHAVAIGPGFGTDEAARSAVEHVVLGWDGIKVVDADAITVFAGRAEALAGARGRLILTPHPGELGRLLGRSSEQIENDRLRAVRDAVAVTKATVVLKGARTLIGFAEDTFINSSGNPALATAGAGDVLSGIIAAFACTMSPERAAAAGVYVHGLAADHWSKAHHGADRGMLASDVSIRIPQILAGLMPTSAT